MFPVMGSPKCVAFRSKRTGNFLRSVHADAAGSEESGRLFFAEVSGATADGVDVLASPYTRFYLEPSEEHDGLLHVRCCHNNGYWAAAKHDGGSGHWIISTVSEPDGDLSKPSCTLFQPVPLTDSDNNISIRLLRPQQTPSSKAEAADTPAKHKETSEEAYLCLGTGGGHEEAAAADFQEKSLHDLFVYDLSRQVVLPQYVAFKGDNHMYLRARYTEGHNYLDFTASDVADSLVVNTVFPNYADGTVRIKSNHWNKFWRRSPNWIWADSTDTTGNNRDTLFRVVQLSGYIALQNMGNSKFCKRLSADGKTQSLNAAVSTITAEAKIRVVEAVLSREIYNVEFKLSEARIYNEKPLSIPSVTSINRTSQQHTKKLTLTYEETESKTWTSTVSLKIGVTTSFRAGVPIIADGKVEVSTEFSGAYEWGASITKTTTHEVAYEVIVPAMTKVTLRAAVTQGSVDVPFSYTQKDILTTGLVVTSTMHDGLFTGLNSYNFHYETTEEPV